jgi:hypothetical protein
MQPRRDAHQAPRMDIGVWLMGIVPGKETSMRLRRIVAAGCACVNGGPHRAAPARRGRWARISTREPRPG